MNFLKITLTALILLIPSYSFAGTSYYVDPSQSDPNEDGSYEHPWNSIEDVNSHAFSTGDDVYFKAGSYMNIPKNKFLNIDWTGSKTDQVIIGAYSTKGNFRLNGGSRPIFDGNFVAPGENFALIRSNNQKGYTTIRDLRVQNSNWNGIEISYDYSGSLNLKTINNKVLNCYTKNTVRKGIILYSCSNSMIKNNTVERASYNYSPGGGIVVSGSNNENVTLNNTISGNTVYWCYEGIGIYQGARYTTTSNNIVYDCRSYHIYVANSRDAKICNNIVYETEDQLGTDGRDALIVSDSEGHIDSFIKVNGNVEILNNLIAGGSRGIALLSNSMDSGIYQSNNIIAKNIIVDCNYNFQFGNSQGWSDNEIRNNISVTVTDGTRHSNNYSPTGVVWDDNTFDDVVSGNASNGATYKFPMLKKSGWRTLTPGEVTSETFRLDSGSGTAQSVSSPGTLTIIEIK